MVKEKDKRGKMIKNHVQRRSAGKEKSVGTLNFAPVAENQTSLSTQLINSMDLCRKIDNNLHHQEVYCNTWHVSDSDLVYAIRSIPRHFEKANSSFALLVSFITHGENGKLLWNSGCFSVIHLIEEILKLNCPYIRGVAFFSCESLKNVEIPRSVLVPIVGFTKEIPFDDMIFFASRILNNFRHSKKVTKAVQSSKRSESVTNACVLVSNNK